MMETITMRGHAAKRRASRPSKRYEAGRVCIQNGCTTKLSTYNKRDHCYAHAPTKFPRTRGHIK